MKMKTSLFQPNRLVYLEGGPAPQESSKKKETPVECRKQSFDDRQALVPDICEPGQEWKEEDVVKTDEYFAKKILPILDNDKQKDNPYINGLKDLYKAGLRIDKTFVEDLSLEKGKDTENTLIHFWIIKWNHNK